MPSISIGSDVETGQEVIIGDAKRQSGLYILGNAAMGKRTLLVNILLQDITNGHGVFFLDPHGDAITELLNRTEQKRLHELILLDPTDEVWIYGINVLACRNITSLKERTATYTRAYNVFHKLWEGNWSPWLQLIMQNTLWAFIENQEYTLADVPRFLNPHNTQFRNHIIDNIT
jgi:hypothetical protein